MLFSSASIVTVIAAVGADEAPERSRRAADRRTVRAAQRRSQRATARMRKSCAHCATSRPTAPVPLQLERERARELEGRGEEHRGSHRLTSSSLTTGGNPHARAARARRPRRRTQWPRTGCFSNMKRRTWSLTGTVCGSIPAQWGSHSRNSTPLRRCPMARAAPLRSQPQPPSFSAQHSFSCAGLPCRRSPIPGHEKSEQLVLAARYSASWAGLRAITSSITRSWQRCRDLRHPARRSPHRRSHRQKKPHVSNTSLAILPEMVWSQMRRQHPRRRAAEVCRTDLEILPCSGPRRALP